MTSNSVADVVQDSIKFGRGAKLDESLILADDKNLNGRYCGYFYNRAEITSSGRVFMCCPNWLPVIIGDLKTQTMKEIWNGPTAQKVRQQIFDGNNWPLCRHKTCPKINQNELIYIKDIDAKRFSDNPNDFDYHQLSDWEVNAIKNKSTVAEFFPHDIQIGTDESCNLRCPSCRAGKIMYTSGKLYEKRKSITDKIFDEILDTPKDYPIKMWVTGGGDPFGSKIFRERLQTLDLSDRPNTEIHFQTNGVMLTPKVWNSISKIHNNIGSIIFSFDAGKKETYENLTRIGGHWDPLVKNVDYIFNNYDNYENFHLNHNFVVQTCNYKEIPDFLQMVVERWVKPNIKESMATFSLILDWGHMSDYDERAIWKNTHPEHEDFLRVLQDPRLMKYRRYADYGNMTTFVEKAHSKDTGPRYT